MFKKSKQILRELGSGGVLSISIEGDEEGYFDRECPSEDCMFLFKMHEEDWLSSKERGTLHCPFCGHEDGSDCWWTQQQIQYIHSAGRAQLQQKLNDAMASDARDFNRQRKPGGFLTMTLKVDSKPSQVQLPPAAAGPMTLKIECPSCACRYAVVGAAFFCPSCGHSAAEQVFGQSLDGIVATLGAVAHIREAVPDRDVAENMIRLLAENGLQNAVTAFQRVVEVLYSHLEAGPEAKRNAFQNLSRGNELWLEATGRGYDSVLDEEPLGKLRVAFQQRHLLAHREGMVDEEYIAKSGDTRFRPGQR